MAAKEAVFRAQDALAEVVYELSDTPPLLRRMEKRLGKVRAELEALDRDFSQARVK